MKRQISTTSINSTVFGDGLNMTLHDVLKSITHSSSRFTQNFKGHNSNIKAVTSLIERHGLSETFDRLGGNRHQINILVERINMAENWSIETALMFLGRFRALWPKTTAPDASRSTYLTALSQIVTKFEPVIRQTDAEKDQKTQQLIKALLEIRINGSFFTETKMSKDDQQRMANIFATIDSMLSS